jgi:hypothetical protein
MVYPPQNYDRLSHQPIAQASLHAAKRTLRA